MDIRCREDSIPAIGRCCSRAELDGLCRVVGVDVGERESLVARHRRVARLAIAILIAPRRSTAVARVQDVDRARIHGRVAVVAVAVVGRPTVFVHVCVGVGHPARARVAAVRTVGLPASELLRRRVLCGSRSVRTSGRAAFDPARLRRSVHEHEARGGPQACSAEQDASNDTVSPRPSLSHLLPPELTERTLGPRTGECHHGARLISQRSRRNGFSRRRKCSSHLGYFRRAHARVHRGDVPAGVPLVPPSSGRATRERAKYCSPPPRSERAWRLAAACIRDPRCAIGVQPGCARNRMDRARRREQRRITAHLRCSRGGSPRRLRMAEVARGTTPPSCWRTDFRRRRHSHKEPPLKYSVAVAYTDDQATNGQGSRLERHAPAESSDARARTPSSPRPTRPRRAADLPRESRRRLRCSPCRAPLCPPVKELDIGMTPNVATASAGTCRGSDEDLDALLVSGHRELGRELRADSEPVAHVGRPRDPRHEDPA